MAKQNIPRYVPIKYKGHVIGYYDLENIFSKWGNDDGDDHFLKELGYRIMSLIEKIGYFIPVVFTTHNEAWITELCKSKKAKELTRDEILEVLFKEEQEFDETDLESTVNDEEEEEDTECVWTPKDDYDEYDQIYETLPSDVKTLFEIICQKGMEIGEEDMSTAIGRVITDIVNQVSTEKTLANIAKQIEERNFEIIERSKVNPKEFLEILITGLKIQNRK